MSGDVGSIPYHGCLAWRFVTTKHLCVREFMVFKKSLKGQIISAFTILDFQTHSEKSTELNTDYTSATVQHAVINAINYTEFTPRRSSQ